MSAESVAVTAAEDDDDVLQLLRRASASKQSSACMPRAKVLAAAAPSSRLNVSLSAQSRSQSVTAVMVAARRAVKSSARSPK
jgi:hypothetical protein